MKKLITLFGLLIISHIQAQITVTKHDGTPIVNGQMIAYNSTDYSLASLEFYVHNNSAQSTKMKIECVSISNASGEGFELCFGDVCLSAVSPGDSYPSSPVTIPANGTNGAFDHFYNSNVGDGSGPMDYVFRFYQINNNGDEVGNSITFTYRYDVNLVTTGFTPNALSAAGISLKSNVVNQQLDLNVTANGTVRIYDLNGKTVSEKQLTVGTQTMDVSNLSNGAYLLNYTNEKGRSATSKFIRK
jgi:hypothetical protein